jgi:hypothetical protein
VLFLLDYQAKPAERWHLKKVSRKARRNPKIHLCLCLAGWVLCINPLRTLPNSNVQGQEEASVTTRMSKESDKRQWWRTMKYKCINWCWSVQTQGVSVCRCTCIFILSWLQRCLVNWKCIPIHLFSYCLASIVWVTFCDILRQNPILLNLLSLLITSTKTHTPLEKCYMLWFVPCYSHPQFYYWKWRDSKLALCIQFCLFRWMYEWNIEIPHCKLPNHI